MRYLGVGVLILFGVSLTDAQRQHLLRFPSSDADLAVAQDDYTGYYRLLHISALCFLGLVVYLIWIFVAAEHRRRSYAAKKGRYHVKPERYRGLKVVCR